MDISDGMDKSWDHPWTTDEMRKKRKEWSLASDAGLLNHLQQFSDNLISRANKTQESLDSLTTQLNETAILIENVTNTSLALANTQFIESRVQEDDIEIEKKNETSVEQESKNQDLAAEELIASVTESVKQGLRIMDEKYKQMEFVDSDSEEEDNRVVLSVVLGPNNPYQDRPLPYVIGSEKWKNSSKIGLESSSSSESEQVDEEEDSETDNDDTAMLRDYDVVAGPKTNMAGLSSLLSETDYSKRNDTVYMDNENMDVVSQNNVHSSSESVTPNNDVSKAALPSNLTPNFAEELAKRLGTVRQAQKPISVDEKSEASINRLKDDLFTPEGDENALSDNSKNIFSENKFVSDQSSENLWKEKSIKPFKNNIIPASIDVPPPISTVSTKPKSSIDDLFGDGDGDGDGDDDDDGDSEDSNDIFSTKNTIKTVTKNKPAHSGGHAENMENARKKYLNIVAPSVTSGMITSTPETNVNTINLFSDDEDDGDLFGPSKNRLSNKKNPVGGISILGNISASDIENKISNRISRTQSPGSSDSNAPTNYENSSSTDSVRDNSRSTVLNDNGDRSSVVMARNNAENLTATIESSYSSGISIHPPSFNNTEGSSIGVDFLPQMTSTRLKSEEIYRERVASDSLFTAHTRNPIDATSSSRSNSQQEERNEDVSSIQHEDVFENEDLFGPPPLPKADTKTPKSKVSSLFDDSDSGDELFSTTSSGSRSQKSTDFLTPAPQHSDKSRLAHGRGLFDEEIDIFASKDSPDVDIFGTATKSVLKEENNFSARKFPDNLDDALFATRDRDTASKSTNADKGPSVTSKKISLFDDEDDVDNEDYADDGDLFAARPTKSDAKTESRLFNDDDESDLFAVKKVAEKQTNVAQPADTISSETENVKETLSTRKNERKASDILAGNRLFSSAVDSRGLVFEDDDYDDLFANKSVTAKKRKASEQSEAKEDSKDVGFMDDTETSVDSNVFTEAPQESKTVPVPIPSKVEQSSEKDVCQVAPEDMRNVEKTENGVRKSPPKSLNIHTTTSSSPPEADNQATRRTVSGKIKNLMGRMGDLKILSPMDTPPLWRKSDEKTDEEDSTADRDSDDGGCMSTQGNISPPSVSEDSTAQKQSIQSTVSSESNVESAISFDEPAQVETLSTAASKTRVRIQAKRRPQSRHARKTALRHSGIDFDTVDASGTNLQDETRNQPANAVNKESTNSTNVNAAHTGNSERLLSSTNDNLHRIADPNNSLLADDRSELGSISKESSMSANRNTLLSPSTDEEDLFDVPPDLPEDPQKEDTLFGRAPILSPVDKLLSEKPSPNIKPPKETYVKRASNVAEAAERSTSTDKTSKLNATIEPNNDANVEATISRASKTEHKSDSTEAKDELKDLIDPLRDSSRDPLKDPSQLFAFVTKTPSPEKGKNLLFSEDDSLFISGPKKSYDEQTMKKSVLDLFADDTEGDLFSATLSKPVKKPLKDTKISLFDDDGPDDEEDSLFGSVAKKSAAKAEKSAEKVEKLTEKVEKSAEVEKPSVKIEKSLVKPESEKKRSTQPIQKKISLFDDDDDTNLFFDQSEQAQKSDAGSVLEESSKNEIFSSVTERVKTSHITDIFADQSSGEDDIFATKRIPKKVVTSKSLFPSDDDDDDDTEIFGKKSSAGEPKIKAAETRSTVKKSVMRDLKKTAEKIAEDPLSILQDD